MNQLRDGIPLLRGGASPVTPSSAKDLVVSVCNVHRAIELNALWHSRLPVIDWSNVVRASPSVCFVAEYDDVAYGVGIWSSPCARLLNCLGWLELRRLAIAEDAPRNTATRMLSVMRNRIKKLFPEIVKLISYQDTEVHSGTIYKAAGWIPTQRNECGDWQRPNRQRNAAQSLAPKIRWEIDA